MSISEKFSLRSFGKDRGGATAVEFAIVGPLFLAFIFGIVHLGIYFFGVHQAQQTSEATAREVRLMSMPTKDEILEVLKTNSKNVMGGAYKPEVTLIDQYGGTYAEIKVNYTYSLPIPFAHGLELSTDTGTKVLLREMPS